MFKNPTPKQLAFYVALATSLMVFIVVIAINITPSDMDRALNIILLPLLTLILCYFIAHLLIENFIYRRIKIIYKKISDAKKGEILPSLGSDTLDDVENEVDNWTVNKNKEIETLKELEEYRRNYIGNVSHELKTPIFNIQGFLHTLIDGGVNDPSVNLTYLQKAARNVERLNSIVEDLDKISRLESGKLTLDLQVFDIQTLVNEVFEDMDLKAKAKNIKLSFKEGANHGYRVRADKEQIRQVLTNLIANSVKYGKPNGQTKISFYDMDKIVLIEVSDNGIGIARHHLKHLFDRFYRVDKSRSRDVGGTGLGLAIVKHIVEAHNQSVHVRSTEGVGSTFGFTLEKVKGGF
ncbi:MAG: sensor histidine kinase [Saprospiraceae bacterium]|nr:sensor histidine kinase [Saprospiraceae bacterium]